MTTRRDFVKTLSVGWASDRTTLQSLGGAPSVSTAFLSGTGSPEGVVAGEVSAIYRQTDGVDGKTLWRKETGAGNTGWTLESGLVRYGTGTPEAAVTGTVGTVFVQTNGANGKTLWRKRTVTGNTGWALMQGDLGMFNVRDYGAKGDGVTNDRTAFADAQTAAGPAGPIIVPPGTYLISSSITFTSAVQMLPGAKFKRGAAAVITFTGAFDAGTYQVFDDVASDFIVFSATSAEVLYPEWWPNCKPDRSTNCAPAYVAAITAAPEGGRVHISRGEWKFTTQLLISSGKRIDLIGDGTRSRIWLEVGVTVDGIVWGATANNVNQGGAGMLWRDFMIAGPGGASACKNALVLVQSFNSRYENVHIRTSTAVGGYGVWCQRSQGNYFNFIISGNITYPNTGVAVGSCWGGMLVSAADGVTSAVSEANHYDLIIEGGYFGLKILAGSIGNGNDYVTGLYEGIGDTVASYGIHYKGGSGVSIHDFYTEGGTYSEIVLEDHYWGRITNGNSHGVTGDPGGGDIKLINSVGCIVDMVSCSVLSIDANCRNTQLGRVLYNGQSVSRLNDLSSSTQQLMVPGYFHNPSTLIGAALPGPNLLVNGSGERWNSITAVPPGWQAAAGGTWAREATIVKDGRYSVRFTSPNTTARAGIPLLGESVLSHLPPYATIVASGWVYIPTGNSPVSVQVWWNSGAEVRGVTTVTARDQWVHVKFAFPARGINENRGWASLQFLPAAAGIVYLDGWSAVCFNLGAPTSFVNDVNAFYTGEVTWNPASIPAGGTLSLAVACPGALFGMTAAAGAGVSVAGLVVSATVTAADVVTIVLYNPTAGAIDLASSRWTVSATKVVDPA